MSSCPTFIAKLIMLHIIWLIFVTLLFLVCIFWILHIGVCPTGFSTIF
ncbi:hypothetical protein LINGRAHAP2_LOCUS14299 [Linum grandiflorum]